MSDAKRQTYAVTPEEIIAISDLLKRLPSRLYVMAIAAIQHVSLLEALSLVELGASIAYGRQLSNDELLSIRIAVEFLGKISQQVINADEETALELTYEALRAKQLNWERAALIASTMMGETIKPDAWRKRVEKWRVAKDLPPVEQRKRTRPT